MCPHTFHRRSTKTFFIPAGEGNGIKHIAEMYKVTSWLGLRELFSDARIRFRLFKYFEHTKVFTPCTVMAVLRCTDEVVDETIRFFAVRQVFCYVRTTDEANGNTEFYEAFANAFEETSPSLLGMDNACREGWRKSRAEGEECEQQEAENQAELAAVKAQD